MKHEDPDLDPVLACKKFSVVAQSYSLSAMWNRYLWISGAHWPNSLAKMSNSVFSVRLCLRKCDEEVKEDT